MKPFDEMSREDLLKALRMFAKSWLAHDGCWFLATERAHGLDEAIRLDTQSWAQFAAVEARRIMSTFDIPRDGGLQSLEEALALRMYGLINDQHSEAKDGRLRFYMDRCQVQEARRQKGLPDFPCKSVGMVEFSTFARTIDARISTTCLHCPPDAPDHGCCAWEFTMDTVTPVTNE